MRIAAKPTRENCTVGGLVGLKVGTACSVWSFPLGLGAVGRQKQREGALNKTNSFNNNGTVNNGNSEPFQNKNKTKQTRSVSYVLLAKEEEEKTKREE